MGRKTVITGETAGELIDELQQLSSNTTFLDIDWEYSDNDNKVVVLTLNV